MPNWFIEIGKLVVGISGMTLMMLIIGGLIGVIIDRDDWTTPLARIISALAIPFCILILVGIFGMTFMGWK